jgi:hypothetical protein
MARTTKVDRFLVRLIITCFLLSVSQGQAANGEENFKSRILVPSIVAVSTEEPNPRDCDNASDSTSILHKFVLLTKALPSIYST